MKELFWNKYRIKSIRLPKRDYRNIGAYFVTFNVKDRKEMFGKVVKDEMILSKLWLICSEEIIITSKIRDNVEIDKYIVMPDHVHMIIMITNKTINNDDNWLESWWLNEAMKSIQPVETPRGASLRDWWSHHWNTRTTWYDIKTEKRDWWSSHLIIKSTWNLIKTNNHNRWPHYWNEFGPQPSWSLQVIINQMKWSITRRIKKHHPAAWFARQPRYYEHIIRHERELNNVRRYIEDNPRNWKRKNN